MMKRFRRASGSLMLQRRVPAVRVEPGASMGSVVSGLGRLRGLLAWCVS